MVDRVLIRDAVDRAFKAFEGMVKKAQLTTEVVEEFDWSSGQLVSTPTTKTIDVLLIKTTLDSDDSPLFEFLVKEEDFEISNYNSFVIEGYNYRLEEQEIYDGVIVLKTRRSST